MMLRARPRPPRAGFTLIEVLLVSVLAATLLAALWALLSMYLKLFDAGQVKIEQSQLVRTLFAQMETDLASVVQSPPPVPVPPVLLPATPSTSAPAAISATASGSGTSAATGSVRGSAASSGGSSRSPSGIGPPIPQMAAKLGRGGDARGAAERPAFPSPGGRASRPGGGAPPEPGKTRLPAEASGEPAVRSTHSLRPSGVYGTETTLRIDVAQPAIVPFEPVIDEQRAPGELGPSRAGELLTIVYAFEETHEPGRPLDEPTVLLVRREMAWEDSHPAKGNGTGGAGLGSSDPADRRGEASGMGDEPPATDPLSPTTEAGGTASIPEVSQFAIRYYDGAAWSTTWNSIERQGLPVAIEVSLQLKPQNEQGHQPPAAPLAGEEATESPAVPVHRLLVHLPAAQRASSGDESALRGTRGQLPGGNSHFKEKVYGPSR